MHDLRPARPPYFYSTWLDHTDDIVTLEVSDTGIGIEERFLDDLFEAFTRGVNGSAEQDSRLGLAITKRLTELMNGSIDVKSTFGEGTTFTITFPREASPEPRSPNALA